MLEFRLLGPVQALMDGSAILLGGPRHRRLLSVLLLHAGQVVSTGTLLDALWGEAPPRSAPMMLQVRISEVRSFLRVAGPRLLSQPSGYQLRVGPDELDVWRFERLVAAGAAALAAGKPERARDDLSTALGLWNGRTALAEFAAEPFARAEVTRLDELRMQAVELRLAADLETGRHSELVPELEKLVAEHPFREPFWTQLMLALYRASRRADALNAYQRARALLAEELGLDPGEQLRSLHRAILITDPSLLVPATTQRATGHRHRQRPHHRSRQPRRADRG